MFDAADALGRLGGRQCRIEQGLQLCPKLTSAGFTIDDDGTLRVVVDRTSFIKRAYGRVA